MGKHNMVSRTRFRVAVVTALVTVGSAVAIGYAGAAPELAEGTPCSVAARACVSLEEEHAWLIEDGEVVRGPVQMSPGDEGRETPTGDFRVEWKNKDHRSTEFDGAPMPWAVFFAPGGIAFHEGNLQYRSAGCVRLDGGDAQAFYEFLAVGDRVEVR